MPTKEKQPKTAEPSAKDQPANGRTAEDQQSEDLVRLYLREVGQHKLLTADQEVTLAKAIEAGKEAQERLDNARSNMAAATRKRLERDIDEVMQRTRARPLPSRRVAPLAVGIETRCVLAGSDHRVAQDAVLDDEDILVVVGRVHEHGPAERSRVRRR
jgi:hypothetical protein